MKRVKKLIFGAVAFMLAGIVAAQDIDHDRMNRDIEIAENILNTLSNQGEGYKIYMGGMDIEGSYLEGYGVIFSIPQNIFMIRTSKNGNVNFIAPEGEGFSYSFSTSDDSEAVVKSEAKAALKQVKEKQEKAELETNLRFEEIMKTFLVDYADLIGQLKPSDRIMVILKSRGREIWFDDAKNVSKSGSRSAEIKKSDLIDYKQGKLTREQALAKVEINTREVNNDNLKDLEIFSSIFAKLYDPNFSRTYYSSSHRLNYEYMEGFGAIFSMKVYSSSNDGDGHTIRTTGESGLSQEERDKKVEAMYPEFERVFKENLVDYGRTIRSLKSDDMVLFKIKLTECRGCDMPDAIEVSIKASVLNDFNTGKINRDKAIAAINVKKN